MHHHHRGNVITPSARCTHHISPAPGLCSGPTSSPCTRERIAAHDLPLHARALPWGCSSNRNWLGEYSLRTNNRLTTWPLALAHPRALSSALCSLLPSLCRLSAVPFVLLHNEFPPLNDVSVPPRASLGANKAPLAVGLYTRVVVAMKLTRVSLSTSGASSRLDAAAWPLVGRTLGTAISA